MWLGACAPEGAGPAGSRKGPRPRASPESRESCSSRLWLEHGRRCWRLRGPRGQAAGVPASLAAGSHPAMVVSCAGLEESTGVLPGGVAGRLDLWCATLGLAGLSERSWFLSRAGSQAVISLRDQRLPPLTRTLLRLPFRFQAQTDPWFQKWSG